MRTNTCTCSDQVKNTPLYPTMLFKRTRSFVVTGTRKTRMALLAMKVHFFTKSARIVQTPPPLSLLDLPAKIVNKIMNKLELPEASALINTCSRLRNLYTPEHRNWLNIRENCLHTININRLRASRISTPKQFYREILARLLDPHTKNQDLERMATLAEKFCEYLPQSRVKKLLYQVLQRQSVCNLRPQGEKLVRLNFRLCVVLSGIATSDQLAQYTIMDSNALLARLATDCALAEDFLHRMEMRPYGVKLYNKALTYVVNKRIIEAASPLLQAHPDYIDLPNNKGLTVLRRAILHSNLATVQLLLEHKANANLQDAYGNTALIHACMDGESEIVEALLTHGADVELKNNDRRTALMQACRNGNTIIVRRLLQHGAKMMGADRWGDHVFSIAQRSGHNNIVRLLARHQRTQQRTVFIQRAPVLQPPLSLRHFPAEVAHKLTKQLEPHDALAFINVCSEIRNLYTSDQRAWLTIEKRCLALINRNFLYSSARLTLKRYYREVLLRLLDQERSNEDLKRVTALAERFHKHLSWPEIKKQLNLALQQQPTRNLQSQWEKLARINFHLCVTLSGIATLKQLAHYRVNGNFLLARLATDRLQARAFLGSMEMPGSNTLNTALGHAVSKGYKAVVSDLLQAEPRCINTPNKGNITVLMHAAGEGDIAMVYLLLKHKARINLQSAYGNTALIDGCHQGKKNVVGMLLKHGADAELQNNDGQTALMFACSVGHNAMVQLLLLHGVNIDTQNLNQENALSFALRSDHHDIVQLLRNHQQARSANWLKRAGHYHTAQRQLKTVTLPQLLPDHDTAY